MSNAITKIAHDAAVEAWLKTVSENGGELDSALDAAILAALPLMDKPATTPPVPPVLPQWWRPSPDMSAAIADYHRIKADFEAFDGDRRGIAAALIGAESRIVGALELNPEGDECGGSDYALVQACAELIASMIETARKPVEV